MQDNKVLEEAKKLRLLDRALSDDEKIIVAQANNIEKLMSDPENKKIKLQYESLKEEL